MKLGLVLGGGGLVGMGYHAGALKALDESGLGIADADVIVGTSAGSIIGSYLASGWAATDFYEYGMGRHPRSTADQDEQKAEVRDIFIPMWHNRSERVRRSVGSFFALAASRGLWLGGRRGHMPHQLLRKTFPAGLYSTERTLERLREDLAEEWPDRPFYACAADLYSGKRVAFGSDDAPPAPLPLAVLASTAIPGVFPPVHIGDRQYVDGGVVSATSLDLAVDAGCEAILCVAPLGYRAEGPLPLSDPSMWSPMLVRSFFARSLRKEVRNARERGVEVLVVRPWISDLKQHGTNSMRHYDRAPLIENAREGTKRFLDENREHPVLVAFQEKEGRTWSQPSTA